MKARAKRLIACAFALAMAAGASSQEASTDPFDAAAFDSASGAAPAAAAKTEYLVGGTVVVAGSAAFPSDFDGYAAYASASGRLFAKVSVPDYGALYISYNVSQTMFEGLSGSGSPYLVPASDLYSPSFVPAELHYSFDIGKRLFVRIGKQLVAWGPSQVWTPVDFVNGRREDSFSSVDLREGKPALKLHLPLGKANAFAFADFSDMVADGVVRDPAKAGRYAARLDATLGGFELGLTGLAGASVQGKAGFDFSGDLFGSAVYGELAWAPAYSSYSNWVMASLGFSRVLGDLKRWTVSGEAFYDSEGFDRSGDAAAMALLVPLYIGRYYAYASLNAKELFSPDLATTVYALANLSDLSYSIRLSEDFSFPRAVPFTLTLAYAGGGEGKEFTLASGDRSLSLDVKTRIEF